MKLTGTNPFLLATLGCLAMTGVTAAAESEGARDLGTKVRSLLEDRCFECHSHSAKKLKAGLFLDSRSGFLTGGDSGPAIVPGDVENSLLVEAVRYQNVDLQMPPKSKLGDDDIALLESWVKAGAPWPEDAVATGAAPRNEFNLQERRREHWAWQPVRNPALPAVKDADWPAQPPDRFILSKLEAAGLDPAPEADRRTLIRRLSLILTGLPPSPEEVRSFVSDPAPDAYGRLIGRLLASDSFGERWARHWLDVVRYSETLGHEFDYPMPNAWRYRDYAIRAFNADVPYDRFVREHIAGDLLEHPRRDPESGVNESALATAYHWFGQQVHSPVDIKGNQLDVIDNQIDTLTRGFQALTVSCARCHDHKFDAISTKDFYALYGVFASTRYAQRDISSPDAFTEPLGRLTELRAQFTREIGVAPIAGDSSFAFAGWQLRGAAMKDPVVPVGDVVFAGPTNPVTRARVPLLSSRKLSTRLQGAARSPSFVISDRYLHVRAAGRGSRLKLVIENFQMIQNPIYGELKKTLDRDDLGWTTFNLGMWTNRVAYLEALDLGAPDLAGMAGGGVSDSGWFDLAEVIASGDSKPPGREAGFDKVEATDAITALLAEIAVVGGELPEPMLAPLVTDSEGIDQPVLVRGGPGKPGEPVERRFLEALGGLEHSVENGSGRRQVAELIASPENPLTARVWVNRVWHHLFGRGIVPTVDDFGVLGDDPSHPELLDWLAHWFVTEGEWSTKKLIRMLVTSSTWQQSAITDERFTAADPENVLLHKWSVRRLEGEAIRDSILAVSGRLDPTMYGPSVPTHLTDFMTGRGRPGKSGPLDGDGRRSIYLEVRRNFMSPMMLAFDTPQAAQTFGRRARSNVPAQALILMNDPFVQQQAKQFAERMEKAFPDKQPEPRIRWLYAQALQREPSAHELTAALEFLGAPATLPSAEAWADLCHVLFNTKEFVFVN